MDQFLLDLLATSKDNFSVASGGIIDTVNLVDKSVCGAAVMLASLERADYLPAQPPAAAAPIAIVPSPTDVVAHMSIGPTENAG